VGERHEQWSISWDAVHGGSRRPHARDRRVTERLALGPTAGSHPARRDVGHNRDQNRCSQRSSTQSPDHRHTREIQPTKRRSEQQATALFELCAARSKGRTLSGMDNSREYSANSTGMLERRGGGSKSGLAARRRAPARSAIEARNSRD